MNELETMRSILLGKIEEAGELQKLGDELFEALEEVLDCPDDDDAVTRARAAMRAWEAEA